MKRVVSVKDLVAVNTMLYELTCLRRWSEVTVEGGKYTELSKQALNCIIAYFWANEAKAKGEIVDFTKFPKLAIRRGFVKDFQCDVPEANLEIIFHLGNVSKKDFNEVIWQQVSKVTTPAFLDFLAVDHDCLEARIYKAATKIATLIELNEIKSGISQKDFILKTAQIQDALIEFCDLPGFAEMTSANYCELFHEFSKLRNRIRWAKHPNIIKCSVLGHLFDVAVFSYLMALEVHPLKQDLATRYFFIGIFHDIAEKWTGDMPSPIKDAIKGLRDATEEFERMVLEENVYSYLPDHQEKALRSVMLEDNDVAALKKFAKKADNFSAYIECWRELDAGSRHQYYANVVRRDYADFTQKNILPEHFQLLMEMLHHSVCC